MAALFIAQVFAVPTYAENLEELVKKAVEKSTLDQLGTHPFHLKAEYAPSLERDKDSHREGTVEIWWESPNRWRREVRSPEFHQIEIVNDAHHWQQNEGDYFPYWLQELAVAIVRPVPLPIDLVLRRVKNAEVRRLAGQTNIDWQRSDESGDAQSRHSGYVALTDRTGLLFYAGGLGWGGLYKNFKDFHGRMIARTVAAGYIEVTAKISVLEDLAPMPDGFLDANAPGGEAQPIETVVLDNSELRNYLIPGKSLAWPTLQDGPFEGTVWTELVLDRTGKIREINPAIADNPGVKDVADQGFRAMKFQPVLRDGIPVQVMGSISENFKTVRPQGVENFESAKTYFERGRKASCLGAGANSPYTLRAEFETGTHNGKIAKGRYEDTWLSATEWKREAWFGSSHLVRSQLGDKHYVLSEGPEAGLLRLVMVILEPIPAADTMTESDWRIRRDLVGDLKTVLVYRGSEDNSQSFWFKDNGELLKSGQGKLEIRPLDWEDYAGVQTLRRIDVLKDGSVGLRLVVKDIGPADPAVSKSFKLKGHEWQRAFTSEVR